MSTEEVLIPNYDKLEGALRSIGYSFEVAVADIVDNSLDARADNVSVRLMTRPDGHLDLAIWDDGKGMDAATLKEAMRFGSDVTTEVDRLGKFGLGLKLASISQAKEVHVVSGKAGRLAGRSWLDRGIATGFSSTVHTAEECRRLIACVFPDREFTPSATMVWWSRLYRVGHSHGKVEEHAQKLLRRLDNHLSLAFHRFLAGRAPKVKIVLDIFDMATRTAGLPGPVEPLDPFGYAESGYDGFPAAMELDASLRNRVKLTAHIWPPNSKAPEYKLPGGTNARQGFYFYRNNRLIQGGGWNGLREPEPHSSLARLEVDLAPEFDLEVSLDVKKVEIQLPPSLVTSLLKAKSASGSDFRKYLAAAQSAYRTRKPSASELPLIPSEGLPAPLIRFLHEELRHEATRKHHDLRFRWKSLAKDCFFEIDRDAGDLFLNRMYRHRLLHGLPGSSADLPVLKCLLFLALEETISSERMSAQRRERIARINRILVEALRYERRAE